MSSEALSNLLHEERDASRRARSSRADAVAKADLYDERRQGPARLLGRAGPGAATGTPSGTRCSTGQPPFAKWFVGGRLNVAVNCVDRHVEAGNGDRVAFHWEGEPGDTRTDHLRRAQARGLQGRQRADRARRRGRATASRSTCR